MKPKTILTVVLLLFVGASLGYVVLKPAPESAPTESPAVPESVIGIQPIDESSEVPAGSVASESTGIAKTLPATATIQPIEEPEKILVSYILIGSKRCFTCKRIEAWTRESVESGFEKEIQEGTVAFRIVDGDLPANKHYIDDYQMAFKTVVIEKLQGNKVKDWKRLDEVWQLIRQDKASFDSFLRANVRSMLSKG